MGTVVLRCTTKHIEEYEYEKEYVAKEYTDSEGDLVFEIECTGDVFTVYKDSNGFSYRTWFEIVEDERVVINKRELELGILEIAERLGMNFIYSTGKFVEGMTHDRDTSGVKLVSTRLGLFEDVEEFISIEEYRNGLMSGE